MGAWRGRIGLPTGGDYAHGPILHVKYNDNQGLKEDRVRLSQEQAKDISLAYYLAIELLKVAISKTQEAGTSIDKYSELLSHCFTDYKPHLVTIISTLELTLNGLKANNEKNRLHVFTGVTADVDQNATGYVAQYELDNERKIEVERPKVNSYSPKTPILGAKQEKYRGHIHVRYVSNYRFMARNIVHEATHLYAGTGDFAYLEDENWKYLTAEQQINNADSYANFCALVYHNFKGGA